MKSSLAKPVSSGNTKSKLGDRLFKAIRSKDFNSYDKIVDLVKKGVDVNYVNPGGQTPLGLAIDMKWHAVVSLLLENGADPNPRSPDELAPLERAVRRCSKDTQILDALLAFGAEVNTQPGIYPESSIFHESVREYKLEALKFILESGGNIDVVDRTGETPFESAVYSMLVGAEKIVEVMLPYVKTLDIKKMLSRKASSREAINYLLSMELERRKAFAVARHKPGCGVPGSQDGESPHKVILEKEVMQVIQKISERQTGFAANPKTVADRQNQKTIVASLGGDWSIRAVVGPSLALITVSRGNIYNNLPTGEPALLKIKAKETGTFVSEKRFYSNGLLWDPDAETPAVSIFTPDGKVDTEEYYIRGIEM